MIRLEKFLWRSSSFGGKLLARVLRSLSTEVPYINLQYSPGVIETPTLVPLHIDACELAHNPIPSLLDPINSFLVCRLNVKRVIPLCSMTTYAPACLLLVRLDGICRPKGYWAALNGYNDGRTEPMDIYIYVGNSLPDVMIIEYITSSLSRRDWLFSEERLLPRDA